MLLVKERNLQYEKRNLLRVRGRRVGGVAEPVPIRRPTRIRNGPGMPN
jgi:hypothetical protein